MPASRTFLSQKFPNRLETSAAFARRRCRRRFAPACATAWALCPTRLKRLCAFGAPAQTPLIHRTATALFQGVREHQRLLTGWFRVAHLYEFGVYQRALGSWVNRFPPGKRALELRHPAKPSTLTSLSCWPGARWARRCCSSTCMSRAAVARAGGASSALLQPVLVAARPALVGPMSGCRGAGPGRQLTRVNTLWSAPSFGVPVWFSGPICAAACKTTGAVLH